jgi:acyl-coenzyme A thioesterase PaaI-like protein
VAVATETNRAHQSLGTRLLALERHGATIAVDWRDDVFGDAATSAVPNGVITSLLDHACAISAMMSLDDVRRFGGTMQLRVDYLLPALTGHPIHVRAHCAHTSCHVARVRATAYHPGSPDTPRAVGECTVAIVEAA